MGLSCRFHHSVLAVIAVALLAVFLPLPAVRVQATGEPGLPVISARGDEALLPVMSVSCRRYCVGWAVGGSADGYGVILHTGDGGVTWKRQGQVGEIPDVGLSGVSAADAQNAWAVGGQVILHTRDGGRTWRQQELPQGLPQDFELSQVKALGRHTAFAVGSPSVLLRTTRRAGPGDSGRWIKMPTGPHLPPITFSDVDAVSPTGVWAVGGVISGSSSRGGLAIAFYGGRRWRPQLVTHSTQACNVMIGVSVLDTHTAWAVGGSDCPPYRTVNGGGAWRAIGAPLAPGLFDTNRIVAVTHDLIWVAADNGIFRTINGGTVWQQTGGCTGGSFCYAISAAGTKYAWASSFAMRPPGDVYRWVRNHWESQTIPATSSTAIISMAGARR